MEGDNGNYAPIAVKSISIHALRVEGDSKQDSYEDLASRFLSTPSGWRATFGLNVWCEYKQISIHALRVEGDDHAEI